LPDERRAPVPLEIGFLAGFSTPLFIVNPSMAPFGPGPLSRTLRVLVDRGDYLPALRGFHSLLAMLLFCFLAARCFPPQSVEQQVVKFAFRFDGLDLLAFSFVTLLSWLVLLLSRPPLLFLGK